MQPHLESLDSLLCMDPRRAGNDDGLQPIVFLHTQHLVIRLVGADSFQVAVCPHKFILVWRRRSYQIGAGRKIAEVQRMSRTHATQTGNGNFELRTRHSEEVWGE